MYAFTHLVKHIKIKRIKRTPSQKYKDTTEKYLKSKARAREYFAQGFMNRSKNEGRTFLEKHYRVLEALAMRVLKKKVKSGEIHANGIALYLLNLSETKTSLGERFNCYLALLRDRNTRRGLIERFKKKKYLKKMVKLKRKDSKLPKIKKNISEVVNNKKAFIL